MFYALDFLQAKELIEAALDACNREILMFRWIAEGHSRQMSYDEYLKMALPRKKSEKSAEEILNEVEKMMNKWG